MAAVRLAFILLLTGCASTPQGKSIDRSNMVDLASTGYALTFIEGATEANPLGVLLVPIKLMMGTAVDKRLPMCKDRAKVASFTNPLYYGAACSNFAGFNPALGIACGVGYHALRGSLERDAFDCDYDPTPEQIALHGRMEADWELGDTVAMAEFWADDVQYLDWASGKADVMALYDDTFAETSGRSMDILWTKWERDIDIVYGDAELSGEGGWLAEGAGTYRYELHLNEEGLVNKIGWYTLP